MSMVAELYYQYRFTDVYLYTLSVVAELIISIDLQMCICICCQWLQNCIFDSLVARSCLISSLAARSSIISSLVARRCINNISDSCKVCEREWRNRSSNYHKFFSRFQNLKTVSFYIIIILPGCKRFNTLYNFKLIEQFSPCYFYII